MALPFDLFHLFTFETWNDMYPSVIQYYVLNLIVIWIHAFIIHISYNTDVEQQQQIQP